MIDSRKITDLHPTLQNGVKEFLRRCAAEGIKVKITSTYRDIEKQNALYAQGRDASGKILPKGKTVTNAKGGYSWHNWQCAFDIAPILPNGEIDWTGKDPNWKRCGEIWEAMGGEWGGRWTNPIDLPHMQFTNGLTIAQFRAGKRIPTDCKMKWELELPTPQEVIEMRYNTLEELPDWAVTTVVKLISKGALKGKDGGKLDLSEDMLRVYVMHDRMGLYGK